MSNPEVVRLGVIGAACLALFALLGFAPFLIPQDGVWAASVKSQSAMPIGESKPATTMAPFEIKRPDYGTFEYLRDQFDR